MEKVLITGGTGTIGKELLRNLYNEWDIYILSRDEFKQAKLRAIYPNAHFIIGDIREYQTVSKALRGIDVVIHAAALKRIEVCEENPLEAVKTNILGVENVVFAAKERGIEKLISISTDKGVEPVNVYGMTKAIQERIVIAAGYNCVRYGNVFGSRGSVIPLFIEQTQNKQYLTVTDSEMTRFILTTEEAIKLILFAFNSPMESKIFVKKSPAARLGSIAEVFKEKYGIPIKIIGKMVGEKLNEILISSEETTRTKDLGEYFEIFPTSLGLPYSVAYASDTTNRLSKEEISNLLDDYLKQNGIVI